MGGALHFSWHCPELFMVMARTAFLPFSIGGEHEDSWLTLLTTKYPPQKIEAIRSVCTFIKHEADAIANILEATEYMNRNRDCVSRAEEHVAVVAMLSPEKTPTASINDENFRAVMAVKRVCTTWRLPRCANVEAMRFANMDVLVWVLRDSWTNDGEVFLAV